MITAVDSSVILDVLTDDDRFAARSEAALRTADEQGKLVICDCVLAEIYPAFTDATLFDEFLSDWRIEYSTTDTEAAKLAGRYFAAYLERGGTAKRVVPDFLIGAHAAVSADRLLARDRGYLKDYFQTLEVWDPTH